MMILYPERPAVGETVVKLTPGQGRDESIRVTP
jgi:hypothetical protein